jgi:integrase
MKDKVTQRREPRTGTVISRTRKGRTVWIARILLKDGKRRELTCPYGMNREKAEAKAKEWQALEDATPALYNARARAAGKVVDGETADQWFTRMLPIRAHAKGTVDSSELESYWRTWISPVLGKKPMVALQRTDSLALAKVLEAAVANGRIREKTAKNIFSTYKVACKIACSERGWCESLKVRADDPSLGVEGPEDGPSRKRQWLFPKEFAALMACEAVPVERKRLYAFAAYTGMRPGEVAEVRFKDIDREAGVIRVSRAFKLKVNRIGATKTDGGVRDIPIERALLPAIPHGSSEELIFPQLSVNKHYSPDVFREDLRTAGVTSSRLWSQTDTHLRVDFRCLRDSYATWHCLAGLDIHKLMRRMGHMQLNQTIAYAKVAETVQNVGVPFAPLPWAHPDEYGPLCGLTRNLALKLAPTVGLEPTTRRLTAACSTTELSGNVKRGTTRNRYPGQALPRASIPTQLPLAQSVSHTVQTHPRTQAPVTRGQVTRYPRSQAPAVTGTRGRAFPLREGRGSEYLARRWRTVCTPSTPCAALPCLASW